MKYDAIKEILITQYREQLEQKEDEELLPHLETIRQEHIDSLLEQYEEELQDTPDDELFGEEAFAEMREKAIDDLVELYEQEIEINN